MLTHTAQTSAVNSSSNAGDAETLQNCAGDAIPGRDDPSAVPDCSDASEGQSCDPVDDIDAGPLLPGASATYSPEDNKLRLYPLSRLSNELYQRVKAAGFKWAPKQKLFVAPGWTPNREDLLLELCGEIGDEDYSPEERAADRAERFSGYRDKRRAEAGGLADTFDAGPSAFGHQNRQRAERQAARHDRYRVRAVSQWSKAEYWQQRTEGVISHSLYKSSPEVRRSRILTLEAELRAAVANYTPAHNPPQYIDQTAIGDSESSRHVWCGPKGRGGYWVKVESLPRLQAKYARWVAHYEMRLNYERAMLGAEGGSAAELDMEPGGWLGSHQIQKVNRSPVTGRVVSVQVLAPTRCHCDRKGKPYGEDNPRPLSLHTINVERFGDNVYRAPTDEERAAFSAQVAADKAAAKASKPKAPPLINPTDEDAERLQAIWNRHAVERGHKGEPATVRRMTQAEYSAASKGSYAHCTTTDVSENLRKPWRDEDREIVFKVRASVNGFSMTAGSRVIVITDKPQKPIPWEDVEAARKRQPTADKMFHRLGEIADVLRLNWKPERGTPQAELLTDAIYAGLAWSSSMTQYGWTERGAAEFKRWQAIRDEGGEITANGVLYSASAVAAAKQLATA